MLNERQRPKTTEEKEAILSEVAAGSPVRQVAKKHGVSPAIIYNWQARVRNGEPLDPRPRGGTQTPKTKKRKRRSRGVRTERATAATVLAAPPSTAIVASPPRGRLVDLEVELVELRAENARLRAALYALLGERHG